MNFLPLCTASVWPTNSGTIVERLDHVFSTFFCRARFRSSTRASRRASMYGPFASERPMMSPCLSRLLAPPGHDVAVRGPRPAPRLVALGRLAPRRHRMVALALALAAPHRMVDGVHDRAPDGWAEALPPHATGLADRDVLVVEIADLADRRHAVE